LRIRWTRCRLKKLNSSLLEFYCKNPPKIFVRKLRTSFRVARFQFREQFKFDAV
jgi:hypothetical protein